MLYLFLSDKKRNVPPRTADFQHAQMLLDISTARMSMDISNGHDNGQTGVKVATISRVMRHFNGQTTADVSC